MTGDAERSVNYYKLLPDIRMYEYLLTHLKESILEIRKNDPPIPEKKIFKFNTTKNEDYTTFYNYCKTNDIIILSNKIECYLIKGDETNKGDEKKMFTPYYDKIKTESFLYIIVGVDEDVPTKLKEQYVLPQPIQGGKRRKRSTKRKTKKTKKSKQTKKSKTIRKRH